MRAPALLAALLLLACAAAASAEEEAPVHLDFQNAELTQVIDTIAQMTGRNFIYDDRVRGRVTIISPEPMSVEQAYAVFESVLQVKGFTTVETPGGALKVIPLRDAKETSVQTVHSTRPPPNRDTFITRLIPLRYIDSESIVNTLKPLVSKDAAIASYAPTNTVILTESASNIRRIIAILENVDIETYREELAVIRIEYADANTLADQLSEIFGAEVSTAAPSPTRRRSRRTNASATPATTTGAQGKLGKVRIITDERTNALIVLAPRTQLEEVRRLVRKLDVPVEGGGRIHVYYLQHADAEELAQTLSAMISGVPAPSAPAGAQAGGNAPAIRAAVSGLAEGLSVTADPATNSLVIQASQEGFNTIGAVIKQLDVARPQVLVEALIMEVDVTDSEDLGFAGLARIVSGDLDYTIALASDAAVVATTGGLIGPGAALGPFLGNVISSNDSSTDDDPDSHFTTIQGVIRAAAGDGRTNILSAPHILTSDNEEAEIRVGDNIPIVTSRVDAATGSPTLSTSVNVERQDIGVTLRVTPQITEGNTLRLEIFQEISAVNEGLTSTTQAAADSTGVALSKRTVENTVVVADGETVVIGGLIGEDFQDTVAKVPWLGDIPILGWAFKTTSRTLRKQNLLVFLTPHIVRNKDDLEYQTVRKREEYVRRNEKALTLGESEQAEERRRMRAAAEAGEPYTPGRGLNPVRQALLDHEARYPVERLGEIEQLQREAAEERARNDRETGPRYFLQAGVFGNETRAVEVLTALIDLGYDGELLSGESGGHVVHEVRVGPFETLESANRAIDVLERSQNLAPHVLVERPEASGPEGEEMP